MQLVEEEGLDDSVDAQVTRLKAQVTRRTEERDKLSKQLADLSAKQSNNNNKTDKLFDEYRVQQQVKETGK